MIKLIFIGCWWLSLEERDCISAYIDEDIILENLNIKEVCDFIRVNGEDFTFDQEDVNNPKDKENYDKLFI